MSHSPTQFCSLLLVSLILSVFFHSVLLVSRSFWLPFLPVLPLLLLSVSFYFSVGLSVCLALCLTAFSSPLNGCDLYVSLRLSSVSMGTVPGCHGDSVDKVMLSHVGGLSWQEIRERETCQSTGCNVTGWTPTQGKSWWATCNFIEFKH